MRIPFEKQHNTFSCGAAALAMVYRSLGRDTSQEEIWPLISRKEGASRWASPTYRLCQDAIRRGFAGMVLQARQHAGWRLLEQCHRHGLFAILHHRAAATINQRHFSVLVDWSPDHVVVHDPRQGPEVRHTRDEFLLLWGPKFGSYGGHFMVVLAETSQAAPCPVCGTLPPPAKTCPVCRQEIRFEPAMALGCADPACSAALWTKVFCPQCDASLVSLTSTP